MNNTSEARWTELQAQYRAASDAEWRHSSNLKERYGSGVCYWVYATRTEQKRKDALRARTDRIMDKIIALMDKANPGNRLHTGAPAHTICSTMTFAEMLKG